MANPIVYPPIINGYSTGYNYGPVYAVPGGYSGPVTPEYYAFRGANMMRAQMGMPAFGYGYGYGGGFGYNNGYGNSGVLSARPARTAAERQEAREEIAAVKAAHPEMDRKAITMIARAERAHHHRGRELSDDPRAMAMINARISNRIGDDASKEVFSAMGYGAPESSAVGKITPGSPGKTEEKGKSKTPAAVSTGSTIGSGIGLLAGGGLGALLMSMFGGGFSVIGIIAAAALAVVGSMAGGRGGAMIGSFFAAKPDATPDKPKAPSAAPATPLVVKSDIKKLEEAAKKFHEPAKPAVPEASGVEATAPSAPAFIPRSPNAPQNKR